jgi:hypothetical protein
MNYHFLSWTINVTLHISRSPQPWLNYLMNQLRHLSSYPWRNTLNRLNSTQVLHGPQMTHHKNQRERDAWSQIWRNRSSSLGETTTCNGNGNTPDQVSISKKQVRSHYEDSKSRFNDNSNNAYTHGDRHNYMTNDVKAPKQLDGHWIPITTHVGLPGITLKLRNRSFRKKSSSLWPQQSPANDLAA